MTSAGVVSEQRARGCDESAADREGDRGVPDRQQRGNLADQAGDQLQVPAIRLQQVPGMRERPGQVDARVLGVGALPDRPAADTGQHHQRAKGDRGDLDEQERPAREASAGATRPAPGTGRRARRGPRGPRPPADPPRTRPGRAPGAQARTRLKPTTSRPCVSGRLPRRGGTGASGPHAPRRIAARRVKGRPGRICRRSHGRTRRARPDDVSRTRSCQALSGSRRNERMRSERSLRPPGLDDPRARNRPPRGSLTAFAEGSRV